MEISTSVAVMQCLYAVGDKKEGKKSKTIHIALVTPEIVLICELDDPWLEESCVVELCVVRYFDN